MSYTKQIKINIENAENIGFNYTFNQNSTFEDLLEFTANNYPESNICPCFKFQFPTKNQKQSDINKDLKINEIISKCTQFNLVNNYSDKKCHCSSLFRDNFKRSKIEILRRFDEYINDVLEKEKSNLKKNIDSFENEKAQLKQEISTLKEKNEILEENKKKLELELQNLEKYKQNEKLLINYKEENEKLKKNNKLLELAINGDIETINQLRSLGMISENLQPKQYEIKIDEKTNEIIGNAKPLIEANFVNFYDVIIDIKSIKDISKGWQVKFSKRAEEKYQEFKKEKIIKIGVIGNSNKGKSFLLSRISKIELPSGTSIRTEGLSIKYPELDLYKDRRIALLDSAGLETPVLKENIDKEDGTEEKEAEKKANDTTVQNKEENEEVTSKGENENENQNEEKNDKELFKEKSREKIITELFLQNYIINNSDILLVVVGILTYSEQKLLNRIKTEIQRSKINKPLFIIHNLITYTSIKQVEDYITHFLLKSATFNLEEGHKISTKTKSKSGAYYYEKKTEPKIYHLIFANEGSEAGKHYNNFTLDFLEGEFQRVTDLRPFDVIQTVKERFIEVSKDVLEKCENPLSLQDFDNNPENKTIKLVKHNNVKLKKCLIDELGFSNLKANGFEPAYNYYKKDDKVIIRVEAPGNSSIKSNVDSAGEYKIVRLTGNKKKDKEPAKLEDNLFNSREFGTFSLDIPLKNEDFLIKNENPSYTEKKGVLLLEFKLEEKKEDEGYAPKEEDDI